MKRILLAGALCAAFTVPASANITGNWRTGSGETAAIAKCGGSFCVTLKSGKYAGKSIGKFKGSGNNYSGTITDPAKDRNYSGTATLSGSKLKMRGCALKVFCRTDTWSKR